MDAYEVDAGISDEEYADATNSTVHYFYKVSDMPTTYTEALRSPDAEQWRTAMEEEVLSLNENNTYELVSRPDRPVIGGRWVFSKKNNNDNLIYKARYVAKGYSQIPNLEFNDTFSPTARLTSIRILTNLASKFDLDLLSLELDIVDIETE